jgi:hypothetical protein
MFSRSVAGLGANRRSLRQLHISLNITCESPREWWGFGLSVSLPE